MPIYIYVSGDKWKLAEFEDFKKLMLEKFLPASFPIILHKLTRLMVLLVALFEKLISLSVNLIHFGIARPDQTWFWLLPWFEKYLVAQAAKYLRLMGSKLWRGSGLWPGADWTTEQPDPWHMGAAPATGGKSSSLDQSTVLHCIPNCSARQCNTRLYPASVYWSRKCRQRTWHGRKSLPLCSHPPSSGWGIRRSG